MYLEMEHESGNNLFRILKWFLHKKKKRNVYSSTYRTMFILINEIAKKHYAYLSMKENVVIPSYGQEKKRFANRSWIQMNACVEQVQYLVR